MLLFREFGLSKYGKLHYLKKNDSSDDFLDTQVDIFKVKTILLLYLIGIIISIIICTVENVIFKIKYKYF